MSFYQNKTAFITGGSTGIGLAVAKALAIEGSNVVIFARTINKLESAVNEIKAVQKNKSQKVYYYSVDTSDNNDVKTVFEKAILENGIPDILINCVGLSPIYKSSFQQIKLSFRLCESYVSQI